MPFRDWSNLATTDFAEGRLSNAVALLPLAATEQHGPHLPLGTDAIIGDGVVAAAAGLLKSDPVQVLRLPTQPIGLSPEHAAFPGTLTLEPATVLAAWTDIATSVRAAGIERLVLFNTHGGQEGLLPSLAATLRSRLGMIAVYCSRGGFGRPAGLIPDEEAAIGLHAGLVETSLMLALAPDLVRRDQAQNFTSRGSDLAGRAFTTHGRSGWGWAAQDLNPAGAMGNAAGATEAIGQALLAHAADGLARLLRDVAGFKPYG
ncbi:creatininase family protein [Roseiterribacter gracilis]|uniref:Creatininase n=1 Tax=Roseiterribacter gracilis TaxID=2812848 RepID=A0A8S8X8W6_9PROT|nr:creatininase [Rhodospirillales bacterium TMPK1]